MRAAAAAAVVTVTVTVAGATTVAVIATAAAVAAAAPATAIAAPAAPTAPAAAAAVLLLPLPLLPLSLRLLSPSLLQSLLSLYAVRSLRAAPPVLLPLLLVLCYVVLPCLLSLRRCHWHGALTLGDAGAHAGPPTAMVDGSGDRCVRWHGPCGWQANLEPATYL